MKNFTKQAWLILFLFIVVNSHAQLSAGIKAGINYAGFSNHEGGKLLRGHAGFFIHTSMSSKWHLQPELLYSCEGQKYKIIDNEATTERTVSVNTVSLPVMLQYFAGKGIYLEAGPQLSVIASAKDKGPGGEKLDVKRSMCNTLLAFNVGAGIMFSNKAGISFRYSLGLTDLTRFDNNADYSRCCRPVFY